MKRTITINIIKYLLHNLNTSFILSIHVLRSFLLSIKMIIIIFLTIIFSFIVEIFKMFFSNFTSLLIKDSKYSGFTCFTSFLSIKLVNLISFHCFINLFKLSSSNKSWNKNKFSILNLTRSNSIKFLIIILVIVEVLLYLHKLLQ